MFIDRTKIRVQGGHGGNGVTAFRREKFVPRGGPSGGDGGRGGDVWLEADESLNTLLHLRYNPEHIAERGRHGEGANRAGRDGSDTTVRVPIGTQVFDAESGELLKDFTEDGERWLAARGGDGGLGDRFLRHVERTNLLLHLVDVSSLSGRDAVSDYETINRELRAYDAQLAARPQVVVATKIDALDEPERLESLRQRAEADRKPF